VFGVERRGLLLALTQTSSRRKRFVLSRRHDDSWLRARQGRHACFSAGHPDLVGSGLGRPLAPVLSGSVSSARDPVRWSRSHQVGFCGEPRLGRHMRAGCREAFARASRVIDRRSRIRARGLPASRSRHRRATTGHAHSTRRPCVQDLDEVPRAFRSEGSAQGRAPLYLRRNINGRTDSFR